MGKKVVFRYFVFLVIGIVCIGCSLWLIDFYTLDGASLGTGEKNGEPIIQALEQYHQDHGDYPKELESLVPIYMKSVPKPAWRYLYDYDACSADNYVLSFRRSNDVDTYCGYVSSKSIWMCSDSYPPVCLSGEDSRLLPYSEFTLK